MMLTILSCNKTKKETKKMVSQLMEDTLSLPIQGQILYKDSLYQKNNAINYNAKFKITTLLWGDCHSCIADLEKWEDFYLFTENNKNIELLFFLYTSDLEIFKKSLYTKDIHKYPLIIDPQNKYIVRNNLSIDNKMYQTFLLDSNNKVILVGNPIYNEKLMKLYKEEINKRLD